MMTIGTRASGWIAALLLVALAGGCTASSQSSLTLASTTSTRDSGLLDVLVPMFEQQSGIRVKVIAVGSGQALEMGRRGDADVLLTHAPTQEQQLMNEGFIARQESVMYNDFILVGPRADPAKVNGTQSITEACRKIVDAQAKFVSRGDQSGTHIKEQQVWAATHMEPESPGYIRAGTGMAAALRIANEKRAYTLCDRGTFLSQQHQLDLVILSEGDPMLVNPYTVSIVDPARHPHVNQKAASLFAEFLLSKAAQAKIEKFGLEEHGSPLFFPSLPTLGP